MEIRLLGAELFHTDMRMEGSTDGQTDMSKLIVTFRSFANAPQKGRIIHYIICVTVVIYFSLVSFKNWCLDSLGMVEFRRNM